MPQIQLDNINSDNGCVQRLLLAESRGPKVDGYDFDEMKIVIQAMVAVLQNRILLNSPVTFCAPDGSNTRLDYATAVCQGGGQQFKGFSLDISGNVNIAQSQLDVINILLKLANGGDQDCADHVNMIIGFSKSSVLDPYSEIPSNIGGNSVLQGVYGWRTAGSGTGGANYIAIPASNNPKGLIQGIQFTTIKKV